MLKSATPPPQPSSPQTLNNLLVATLLGAALALVVTLVQERRDRRLRCADDVADLLDLPLLVEIPARGARRAGSAGQEAALPAPAAGSARLSA